MIRRHGWDGPLEISGSARDLVTTVDGANAVGEADIELTLDPEGIITSLWTTSPDSDAGRLLGRSTQGGFRSLLGKLLPDDHATESPLLFLLDDVPVGAMITGYAFVREFGSNMFDGARWGPSIDVCAGWRAGGVVAIEMSEGRRRPVPMGEVAQDLSPADDSDAWHDAPVVPAGGMRRRRRVDVAVGRDLQIDAMFRDTFGEPDGTETILHEYSVTARADARSLALNSVTTAAGVLPGPDCRSAVASAAGVDGRTTSEIRTYVTQSMRGNTTCTHLNDLLRSLAVVGRLASYLDDVATG